MGDGSVKAFDVKTNRVVLTVPLSPNASTRGIPALERVAQAFVHLDAHVVAVDPATHRVYFPLQNLGGRPVMRVMEAP